MIALITERTEQPGFCGSQKMVDYIVLYTDNGRRLKIPEKDFPFDCREVGNQVVLDYVSAGNGVRYVPIRKYEEAA